MYTSIVKTNIFLAVLVSGAIASELSYAHPEMDAWGRDITSGPLPPMAKTQDAATGEITGSIRKAVDCKKRNGTSCVPESSPRKPRELPGDN